ncbi:MAG: aldehyde ferredoxin oxidoreductase family protein [Anaerolineales bacterium]|nr:MAG: aldehyde ferredoxin oxidoreductase family protein [Anaerolineales bacterium]
MRGYLGKILVVDATTGELRDEPLNETYARQFIGNSGLAARYLYDLVDADTDPLGPYNPLIMMTGALTGTRTPASSRHAFVARSPLTGILGEANVGGFTGRELRRVGYDGIIVTGQSPVPVYLWLSDDRPPELRDASHLWGLDTYNTQARIVEELGQPRARVACIGPAGENLVRYAAILNADARAAGRTGMGTVMGSKRLKAIAIRGRGEVPLSDKERFKQAARRALIRTQGDFSVQVLKETGTSGGMDYFDMVGNVPFRYWTQGRFEGVDNLNGGLIAETIATGHTGCWGCAVQCGFEIEVPQGPYPVPQTDGPEYETLCALGNQLLIDDLGAVSTFDLLCDRLGLDTISTGGAIGFAFWLYNNGLITPDDTDGLRLTWGDPAPVIELIGKIAIRDGFGDVLADGSLAMEKRYQASGMAVQINGLDPGMHDPRGMSGMAVVYLTSPRGACHNKGDFYQVEAGHDFPEFNIESGDHHQESGKAPTVARHQNYRAMVDSSGCCQFVNMPFRELPELFSAAWGEEVSLDDLYTAGERIFNLKRVLNLKLGLNPRQSEIFPELWTRPLSEGGTQGFVPDWQLMLREYYEYRQWDWETGRPRPEKLVTLGLGDMADELWSDHEGEGC